MKIVQLANFYTPTSGGLRTSVDAIGRGYRDAGHERVLIVPGKVDGCWFPLETAADLVNRRLSGLADQVVVTSTFAAAEFTRIGAVNVRRVPLGVDLDTFRPADGGPRRDGTVRLVMLSRLSREKRPERGWTPCASCAPPAYRPSSP